MSRRGHYHGGGTLIGRGDKDWFGTPKPPRPRKPPKVGVLKAEAEAWKANPQAGSVLIPAGTGTHVKPSKRKRKPADQISN